MCAARHVCLAAQELYLALSQNSTTGSCAQRVRECNHVYGSVNQPLGPQVSWLRGDAREAELAKTSKGAVEELKKSKPEMLNPKLSMPLRLQLSTRDPIPTTLDFWPRCGQLRTQPRHISPREGLVFVASPRKAPGFSFLSCCLGTFLM